MFDTLDFIIRVVMLFILLFGMFAGVFVFYHSIYKNRDIWEDGGLTIAADVRDELRRQMQDISQKIAELTAQIKRLEDEKK